MVVPRRFDGAGAAERDSRRRAVPVSQTMEATDHPSAIGGPKRAVPASLWCGREIEDGPCCSQSGRRVEAAPPAWVHGQVLRPRTATPLARWSPSASESPRELRPRGSRNRHSPCGGLHSWADVPRERAERTPGGAPPPGVPGRHCRVRPWAASSLGERAMSPLRSPSTPRPCSARPRPATRWRGTSSSRSTFMRSGAGRMAGSPTPHAI